MRFCSVQNWFWREDETGFVAAPFCGAMELAAHYRQAKLPFLVLPLRSISNSCGRVRAKPLLPQRLFRVTCSGEPASSLSPRARAVTARGLHSPARPIGPASIAKPNEQLTHTHSTPQTARWRLRVGEDGLANDDIKRPAFRAARASLANRARSKPKVASIQGQAALKP